MLKHIVFSQQLCPFMPKETKKVFGNTKEDSNQKPLFPLSALGPTVEMMFYPLESSDWTVVKERKVTFPNNGQYF